MENLQTYFEKPDDEGIDTTNSEPITYYFSDMENLGLITAEEEKILGEIIQIFVKKEEEIFGLLIKETIELTGDNESIELFLNLQNLIRKGLEQGKEIKKITGKKAKLFRYIKSGKAKLIMDENEKNDFYKIREDGEYAINKLVLANLKLVIKMANKYKKSGLFDESDLVQEGNLGLIKAAEKFNPEKKNKFYAYAKWRIRKSLNDFIASKGGIIYIPRPEIDNIYRLFKKDLELTKKFGRSPTNEELAIGLEITIEETIQILQRISTVYNGSIKSLDFPLWDDSESETVLSMTMDTTILNPEQQVIEQNIKEILNNILNKLSAREKMIMELRLGLNGEIEHTCEEVGKILIISRQRINQIEKNIKKKMEKIIEGEYILESDF